MNWDDDVYVTANPLLHPLTLGRVAWIFSHVYFFAYIPVTLMSHASDVAAWGLDPRGHHLTNVLLHALNAILLLRVGLLLARRADTAAVIGMSIAALLFAAHPLRAESVSWISDRKDLLCAFLLLLSFGAYLRRWTAAPLLLFLLAALSKSAAIGFPFLLVLTDALWLKRRGLLRTLPFFLVSAVLAAISLTQASQPKQAYEVTRLTPAESALVPFHALGFAIQKTLLPLGLSPIYPEADMGAMLLASALLLAITILCILAWRRGHPAPALAWSSYLILLAPNLAGLGSGMQPVADRYSYLSTIGLFLLAGGGITLLWIRGGAIRVVGVVGCLTVLVLYARSTSADSARWKSSIRLWESVVAGKPPRRDYAGAYLNLGAAYAEGGRTAEAKAVLERAVRVDPTNAGALRNLGLLEYSGGNREKAADLLARATRADPRDARAFYNLAVVLDELGRGEEAVAAMKESAQLGNPEARAAMESLSKEP